MAEKTKTPCADALAEAQTRLAGLAKRRKEVAGELQCVTDDLGRAAAIGSPTATFTKAKAALEAEYASIIAGERHLSTVELPALALAELAERLEILGAERVVAEKHAAGLLTRYRVIEAQQTALAAEHRAALAAADLLISREVLVRHQLDNYETQEAA